MAFSPDEVVASINRGRSTFSRYIVDANQMFDDTEQDDAVIVEGVSRLIPEAIVDLVMFGQAVGVTPDVVITAVVKALANIYKDHGGQ